MKTPKEKAEELLNEHFSLITNMDLNYFRKQNNFWNIDSNYKAAKQCASFCVNEIINSNPHTTGNALFNGVPNKVYWQNVKTELELL